MKSEPFTQKFGHARDVPIELAELVFAFNDMLARIEEGFTRLSHFSAEIAHELRTPVTNLVTQTHVALGQPRSNEEYREILTTVRLKIKQNQLVSVAIRLDW